jgi:hypothetical protein
MSYGVYHVARTAELSIWQIDQAPSPRSRGQVSARTGFRGAPGGHGSTLWFLGLCGKLEDSQSDRHMRCMQVVGRPVEAYRGSCSETKHSLILNNHSLPPNFRHRASMPYSRHIKAGSVAVHQQGRPVTIGELTVASNTESSNDCHRLVRQIRVMSERFTRMRIRDVDLDERYGDAQQSVAKSYRCVGECTCRVKRY